MNPAKTEVAITGATILAINNNMTYFVGSSKKSIVIITKSAKEMKDEC